MHIPVRSILHAAAWQEMKPKDPKSKKFPVQFPSHHCGFLHLSPSKHELPIGWI